METMSCERLLGAIKLHQKEEIIVPRNVPAENFINVWETRKISEKDPWCYRKKWKILTFFGTFSIIILTTAVCVFMFTSLAHSKENSSFTQYGKKYKGI